MSNGNSGGGMMLWFVDSIGGFFRNRRIKKHNKLMRGLVEYESTAVDVLFPANTGKNSIRIS